MDLLSSIVTATAAVIKDLRDPTLWDGVGDSGMRSVTGQLVSPESAMSLHTYFACIRAISEDMGKVPLITFMDAEDPRAGKRARDERIYTLLRDEPNPEMSAMSWRETGTQHLLGWGNHYAEQETTLDGEPLAFWPIHASRVRPMRDEFTGALVYRVWVPAMGRSPAHWIDMPAWKVLHPHGLSPDGIVGYSIAKLAAESLGVSLAAQEYGGRFFANGALFQGVIEYGKAGELDERAYKRVRESFAEKFHGHGHENVWVPPILEDGMKWQQVSVAPEDTQFIELQKFQRSVIASWFRIAPHKVGDLERSTYSNIEQQAREYVVDTLGAHAVRWETELRRKVLRRRGMYCEHLFDALLRGDSKARSELYTKLFSIGAKSPNEVRALENDEPYPGGDTYYTPVNVMTDAEREAKMSKGEGQQRRDRQPAGGTPQQSDAGVTAQADRTGVLTFALLRELKADARAVARIAGGEDHAKAVAQLENHFERRQPIVREALVDAIMTATPAMSEGVALACAGNHAAKYIEDRMGALAGVQPHEMDAVAELWPTRSCAERGAFALATSLNGDWR